MKFLHSQLEGAKFDVFYFKFMSILNLNINMKELVDPATADHNLGSKLQQQLQEGKTKIEKVFQEFVDKQYVSKGKKDNESDGDSNADDIEENSAEDEESVNNESEEEKEEEDSVNTCSLLDSDKDMDVIQIDDNENDIDILNID